VLPEEDFGEEELEAYAEECERGKQGWAEGLMYLENTQLSSDLDDMDAS
jgi:hypothetical protein